MSVNICIAETVKNGYPKDAPTRRVSMYVLKWVLHKYVCKDERKYTCACMYIVYTRTHVYTCIIRVRLHLIYSKKSCLEMYGCVEVGDSQDRLHRPYTRTSTGEAFTLIDAMAYN